MDYSESCAGVQSYHDGPDNSAVVSLHSTYSFQAAFDSCPKILDHTRSKDGVWSNTWEGWSYRLTIKNSEELTKPSAAWQVYRAIEGITSHKASATDAATKTAFLISHEPTTWSKVVGIDIALATKIEDKDALKASLTMSAKVMKCLLSIILDTGVRQYV